MLCLGRHTQEWAIITVTGSDGRETRIRVGVLEIRTDRVRLGFEAPSHIRIHREEVQGRLDRLAAANAAAADIPVPRGLTL